MSETLNIGDTLRKWLGESKDSKEFEERYAKAQQILDKTSGKAELTLEQPSVEQSRAVRDLDIEFQGKADHLTNQRAEAALGRIKAGTEHLGQVGVDSYAGKAKAAADQNLRVLQPGYAELEAGRQMNSDDYRYMLDKEYADRAATRESNTALRNRGDIFNMIKTLGLGGAILLSK
jgi:hypothetical protein